MKILKKSISIILVVATLFSMFAISASAASYTPGRFGIAANSGSNIRYGAGTNYGKVGAASKGTEFEVTQVKGKWGYTPSIRCTNGVKSGWVCLDYCVKKSGASAPSSTYPTGTYTPSSSSGSNVRYGAGTNYGKVGAVKYGTLFTVTKISNGWGYSPDVRCTNGKTGGWVSLKYCTYKLSAPTNVTIRLNVPLMKQNDTRWRNVRIGSKTIGQIGCTTTCCAMVYSYNTGKTVYPHQIKNMLRYSNNDLYWSSIVNIGLTSKAYNCGVTNNLLKTIYTKLKEGRPVIIGAVTSSNKYQHWVVITGFTGQDTNNFSTADFIINDPGYQNCTTLKAFLANGSNPDRTKIVRIMY